MKQAVGKFVECEPNIAEAICQSGIDIGQFAAARSFVRSDELIIGPTDLFVKLDVGRTPKTPPLRVLVKDAADEERVIAHVRAQQKCLRGRGATERDQHIGDVLVGATLDFVWCLQLTRAGKSFEKRSDVVTKFAIADTSLLQNITGQNVEIELR